MAAHRRVRCSGEECDAVVRPKLGQFGDGDPLCHTCLEVAAHGDSDDSSLRLRGRIEYVAWGLWTFLMILLEGGGFIPFEQAVLAILIAIVAMVMKIGTNLTRNNT